MKWSPAVRGREWFKAEPMVLRTILPASRNPTQSLGVLPISQSNVFMLLSSKYSPWNTKAIQSGCICRLKNLLRPLAVFVFTKILRLYRKKYMPGSKRKNQRRLTNEEITDKRMRPKYAAKPFYAHILFTLDDKKGALQ